MLRRQCTNHYKIRPIYRRIRTLAGGKRGRPFPNNTHAEMWLGISLDEVSRMKPSREPWVAHRWPLVELGMTRSDCIEWFSSEYPDRYLPRSACVICPYRSDEHWIELKRAEPASYDEAVEFDRWLRNSTKTPVRKLLNGRPYLHAAPATARQCCCRARNERSEREQPLQQRMRWSLRCLTRKI